MTRKTVQCHLDAKTYRKFPRAKKISEIGIETKGVNTMPREAGYHIIQR